MKKKKAKGFQKGSLPHKLSSLRLGESMVIFHAGGDYLRLLQTVTAGRASGSIPPGTRSKKVVVVAGNQSIIGVMVTLPDEGMKEERAEQKRLKKNTDEVRRRRVHKLTHIINSDAIEELRQLKWQIKKEKENGNKTDNNK